MQKVEDEEAKGIALGLLILFIVWFSQIFPMQQSPISGSIRQQKRLQMESVLLD